MDLIKSQNLSSLQQLEREHVGIKCKLTYKLSFIFRGDDITHCKIHISRHLLRVSTVALQEHVVIREHRERSDNECRNKIDLIHISLYAKF